jgi:phosphotransferase system  glucose/maltose/N-acetylglucosamine-specific IIC component
VTSHDVLDMFGIGSGRITHGHKWVNFAVVIAMAVLYRVIFVVVIKLKQRLPPLKAIAPLVSK